MLLLSFHSYFPVFGLVFHDKLTNDILKKKLAKIFIINIYYYSRLAYH